MSDTTYPDVLERYLNDPYFHTLVDLIEQAGFRHKYTPGELRDAAFCAALRLEMRFRPGVVGRPRATGPARDGSCSCRDCHMPPTRAGDAARQVTHRSPLRDRLKHRVLRW